MRRIAIYIIIGLVVIGFIWWLAHYLTTGRITVTTNNSKNTITLTKVNDDSQDKPFSKQAHGKLSLTLGTGNYVVSVQGNSVATTQAIMLKSGQSLVYNLNPPNASGVEPVAYVSAFNMAADSSQLTYIDTSDNGLSQINSQNTITELAPGISFQSIRWANATYGVGQDVNGKLYLINNGSATPLKGLASIGAGSISHYAITPNKQLFLSVGADIYTGTPGSELKKLYTDNKPFSSLLATNTGVAIVNSPVDGPTDAGPSYVIFVTNAGKALKKNIEVAATAAWSPDSNHIASVDEDEGLTIYDSSLDSTVMIPGNNMGDVIWIDSQTVAYTTNDQVWTYSLTAKKANLVANTPLGGSATELALSGDQAYLYLVVQNNNNYSIRRVGLHNQTVSQLVYQLQDILPETLGEYSLSMINFTHPTVIVQSTPTSPPSFLQDAKTQLQQAGFNLSQLDVRSGVVNQSE